MTKSNICKYEVHLLNNKTVHSSWTWLFTTKINRVHTSYCWTFHHPHTEPNLKNKIHLLLYYACVRLNMFRAPLCPSSGVHDDSIGYHIGRLVLELLLMSFRTEGCNSLRPGNSSILPELDFQPAATREPDGLCGNQCYRRELLMMGVMVPETCWA